MAIVINGSGTVTGLAVGGLPDGTVDEGTLATDSVTAAKIPASLENTFVSGRKNLLINGGFDVWQRGTTGTAQGYNSADRWYISRGGGSPAVSITRETFATTETDIKSKYYLQWVQSTGGTTPYIAQRVEEIKPLLGQEVTVSVWMKAASAVTIDLDVYIDYGDAQSTTLDENTSFSVTTSWQKFQHTFTISSGGTVSANSNLEVRFSPPDSNTITTYFAEAQLELGSTATDFEHRSYGEELALCQRYFCKSFRISTTPANDTTEDNGGWGGLTAYSSATARNAPFTYPIRMRAVPTIVFYNGSPDEGNGLWGYYTGSNWADSTATSTGRVTENHFFASVQGSYTSKYSYLGRGHWTADAEL